MYGSSLAPMPPLVMNGPLVIMLDNKLGCCAVWSIMFGRGEGRGLKKPVVSKEDVVCEKAGEGGRPRCCCC